MRQNANEDKKSFFLHTIFLGETVEAVAEAEVQQDQAVEELNSGKEKKELGDTDHTGEHA